VAPYYRLISFRVYPKLYDFASSTEASIFSAKYYLVEHPEDARPRPTFRLIRCFNWAVLIGREGFVVRHGATSPNTSISSELESKNCGQQRDVRASRINSRTTLQGRLLELLAPHSRVTLSSKLYPATGPATPLGRAPLPKSHFTRQCSDVARGASNLEFDCTRASAG